MGTHSDEDATGDSDGRITTLSPPSSHALHENAEAERAESESGHERPTRRRFLTWIAGAVTGASVLTGRMVGFTPSAAAAPYACVPYNPGLGICLQCFGTCQGFQSCCRALLTGGQPFCCCTCAAGPFACSPQFFRAENYCQSTQALCCCGTC